MIFSRVSLFANFTLNSRAGSQDSPQLPSSSSVLCGPDGGRVSQDLQDLPKEVQLPPTGLSQEGCVRSREQRSGLQNSQSLLPTKLQVRPRGLEVSSLPILYYQGEVQLEAKSRNLGRDHQEELRVSHREL